MKSISIFLCFIFAFLFLSCKEGPQEVQGEFGDGPADPSIQPRVVGVWFDSPRQYWWWKTNLFSKQNDSLPIGYRPGRLLVRFNKIMKSYTVIPNITLTPVEDDYARLNTREAFSIDGQTFEFPIYGNFKIGKSYTVTVKKEVTDITTRNLYGDFQHSLLPEPYLRIINTYPSDGDSNFYPASSFSATFNSTIDINTFTAGVQFVPPVEGNWTSWGNYVNYFPQLGFRGNTWYEIIFSQSVKDTFNNYLKYRTKIKFKTAPFRLSHTDPFNEQQNVNRNTVVYCFFTARLDTSTIRQNFNIIPLLSGSLNIYSSYFSFYPAGGFTSNTTYTVTISSGLRSKAGDNLAAPYVFSFKTGSE